MIVSEPASPTPHPTQGAPAKPALPEHDSKWDAAVKQADPKPGKPAVPVKADRLEFAVEKKPVSSPPVEATGKGGSGATKPVPAAKAAPPVATVERSANPVEWGEAAVGAIAMAANAFGILARAPTDKNVPFSFGKVPFGNLPVVSKPYNEKTILDPSTKSAVPKVTLVWAETSAHAGVIGKVGGNDSAGFVLFPGAGASGTPVGVTHPDGALGFLPDGFTQLGAGLDTAGRVTVAISLTSSKKVVGGDPSLAKGQEGGFAKASGNKGIQATFHFPNGQPGAGKILEVDLTASVGVFAQAGIHFPIAKAEPGKIDPKRVQAIGGGYASASFNPLTFKLEWDGNKPDNKRFGPQPANSPANSPAAAPSLFDTKDMLTGLMPMPKLTPAPPSGTGQTQGVPAKTIEQTAADWIGERNRTFVDNIQWIAEQLNDSLHEASKINVLPFPFPRIVLY